MQSTEALQQAIQRHESYIALDAENLLLRQTLGDLYHQVGRFDDAMACYEKCIQLSPSHAPARSRTASVMISQHRFAEAEKQLTALIENGESDPALLHNLGLSLYYQERWDDARKRFAEADNCGLKTPSNYAYLARALHHLERMDEAIVAGQSWAVLADDAASKGYLALLEMDNGNTEVANKLAREVLLQNPQHVDANVVAGSASVESQEINLARSHFATALGQDKDNGRAWLGLGLVHLYEQEHQEAIRALENANRIFPQNPGIIVTLGWAKIIAKDITGAEQTFEHAIQVNRNFSESHGGLASALALQHQFHRAEEEIKLAQRLDRNSFGAVFAQTTILAVRGNKQAATDIFAHMLERSPKEGVLPLIEHLRIYSTKKGMSAKN